MPDECRSRAIGAAHYWPADMIKVDEDFGSTAKESSPISSARKATRDAQLLAMRRCLI